MRSHECPKAVMWIIGHSHASFIGEMAMHPSDHGAEHEARRWHSEPFPPWLWIFRLVTNLIRRRICLRTIGKPEKLARSRREPPMMAKSPEAHHGGCMYAGAHARTVDWSEGCSLASTATPWNTIASLWCDSCFGRCLIGRLVNGAVSHCTGLLGICLGSPGQRSRCCRLTYWRGADASTSSSLCSMLRI